DDLVRGNSPKRANLSCLDLKCPTNLPEAGLRIVSGLPTNRKQRVSAWMVEYNAPDRSDTLQAADLEESSFETDLTDLKGEGSMSDKIETIPEKTRWEIATKGLTGAYIAISNALQRAVGQKKFEEFNGSLWYEAGKGAKEFANTVGLPTENAVDVEGVTHLLAKASRVPECVFEVIEATKERSGW